MSDFEITEDKAIPLKPFANYEFVRDRAFESDGFTNCRVVNRFGIYHEFIWETRIGKEIFKISHAYTIMSALLWTLWKQTHHANLPITDEHIMKELKVMIGEEYLTEVKENGGGSRGVEEFGDSVRYFFSVAKREDYGGIFGKILKVRDSFTGLFIHKHDN